MAEPDHRGVGLVATNPARTRFFVQQKDERYAAYPHGYSFFGGACEDGETPQTALGRELGEELPETSAQMLLRARPRHVRTYRVGPTRYEFSLFEVEVDDATLETLAASRVYEGERGVVVHRDAMLALRFVWGLEVVVADYLGS